MFEFLDNNKYQNKNNITCNRVVHCTYLSYRKSFINLN